MNILGREITYLPVFGGMLIGVGIIFLISLFATGTSSFGLAFSRMYEQMEDFFGGILGENEYRWIKSFVTNLFFVILIFNLLGLLLDFFGPIWGYNEEGVLNVTRYFEFATGTVNFNLALAIVGVLLTLGIELVSQNGKGFLSNVDGEGIGPLSWIRKFFNWLYIYFPIFGTDIIKVEKESMSSVLFYIAWPIAKLFDIGISLFVGFLNVIGIAAKVISLSFRLFGNMMSGSVLMSVLMVGLGSFTAAKFGIDIPLLGPIILFVQGLLVACIQALVFPLLVAIYIKVARMSDESAENTATA